MYSTAKKNKKIQAWYKLHGGAVSFAINAVHGFRKIKLSLQALSTSNTKISEMYWNIKYWMQEFLSGLYNHLASYSLLMLSTSQFLSTTKFTLKLSLRICQPSKTKLQRLQIKIRLLKALVYANILATRLSIPVKVLFSSEKWVPVAIGGRKVQ